MARAGHHVVVIGRDRARGIATQTWIDQQVPQARTELLIADLSLLSETRNAGRRIADRYSRISVLINNAGVFEPRPIATEEGHDRVLATNLLCPFVLTQVLLPLLVAGAPSRIINIGSSTSDRAQIDPDALVLGRRWAMRRAYSQSKLALMMTTFRLANRLRGTGVVANVVHPGLVATGLVRTGGLIGLVWRGLALTALTEEQGADTALHAALAPELGSVTGIYLKNRRATAPNRQALDPGLLERVWQATERLT
ncbi:short-chain dehydrogenase [Reyranella soli]|uniref:Short-chain dehydrogenase n=2 Tax=Reyranella soli TaxID=1230389 RepID=A0A512NLT0_9HYPH|nr:short-chain dehydrogenase [Reyranella soli]